MNDQELDQLIVEAVSRKATTDAIERTVMTTLKREHRRLAARKLLRVVAFAFGMPLLLAFVGYSVCRFLLQGSLPIWVLASVAIAALTTVFCFSHAVRNFKI